MGAPIQFPAEMSVPTNLASLDITVAVLNDTALYTAPLYGPCSPEHLIRLDVWGKHCNLSVLHANIHHFLQMHAGSFKSPCNI